MESAAAADGTPASSAGVGEDEWAESSTANGGATVEETGPESADDVAPVESHHVSDTHGTSHTHFAYTRSDVL